MKYAAIFLGAAAVALSAVQATPQAPTRRPTFHLFFLAHEIGTETDTLSTQAGGKHLDAVFQFTDRGTAVNVTAALDLTADGDPAKLVVKGRNYRLFASDSEVTISGQHAHVRDLTKEGDVELAGKPFFPIDNYAPVGVQEQLIQYWLSHGRPAEITAAPSGPVIRIVSRGKQTVGGPGDVITADPKQSQVSRTLERLAVDGVVWGRETVWIAASPGLQSASTRAFIVALTTWAGALPFEAVADRWEWQSDWFIGQAVKDRVDDLEQLTRANSPARSGSYALTGATVITGTDIPPVVNATIVIRDNRIAAIGPAASTPYRTAFRRLT